ncbi:MAG: 1,4-alpha-glucan branching protein GlgB [Pedobacter sp.]|uniref:1,4-alpha-glucan branching protein GlgB n=1 Tax=Pedobacter sp. TaxID=1411316 RepID=UPI00339604FE
MTEITIEDTTATLSWFSLMSEFDIQLFKAGKHYRLYNKLGAHQVVHEAVQGTYFAVWAPNASSVSVIGNFNGWDRNAAPLQLRWDQSGIWECFVPGVGTAEYYKYFIRGANGYEVEKGDPYAFHWENPPQTATVTWDLDYKWNDSHWLSKRKLANVLEEPMSVYELHLGSWRRKLTDDGERFLTYREIADELPAYCNYMNFTHVEFMPVMEHPFYGSWGYQVTGFYAPTSRYGTPQDFMYLIDQLHQAGIGVILDWVPSHFPTDEHGPAYFDGTHLYEYQDEQKGFHPDWKSYIFDLGRNEVRAFLISNALFWLDKYHIDGLRVDAVASMLYLDYSRKQGEWVPNIHGGRENLEAVSFLQEFNQAVHDHFGDAFTVAEESTSWPGVTHPVAGGGLGFDLKWMMGWMHDTLSYFHQEPVYRKYHQGQLTFSLVYAFSEKFVLPLSHDEVVYGKGSLVNKMPGDNWQQLANLRLLFGYMYGHPGAKMIFMGAEFAQHAEWAHDYSLNWHENNNPDHQGVQKLLKDLNALYAAYPVWYQNNYSAEGFEWVEADDAERSVVCWLRKGEDPAETLIFIANYTPVVRLNYRIGVPQLGFYKEVFNTDDLKYGGSNQLNTRLLETAPIPYHKRTHSLSLTVPPLGMVILKYVQGYDWLS